MARILVIDDEDQLRDLLRLMLERAGHDVLEAPDGDVGVATVSAQQVDMVITDMVMPNKEGSETIREIRKSHPQIKIIAISGGGHRAAEDHVWAPNERGPDMALAKPFKSQELVAAVEQLLGAAA